MSDQLLARHASNNSRRSLAPVATLTCAWAILGILVLPRVDWSTLSSLTPPDSLGAAEVLLRSPNPPLDGLLLSTQVLFAAVWIWVGVSIVVEVALALLELTSLRGAKLAIRLRGLTDRLTFPLARRAVAAALLVQIVARPAAVTFAAPAPTFAAVVAAASTDAVSNPTADSHADGSVAMAPFTATYVVKRGDTLWSIAERYYGAGDEFDRLVDANAGRLMPDGRRFERAGLIYPGWTLAVPLAIEDSDGSHWYVVRSGDTLRGIAGRLLGDQEQYVELFRLNVDKARVGDAGPVLGDPDVIWPGMRLRLSEPAPAEEPPSESSDREDNGGRAAETVTSDAAVSDARPVDQGVSAQETPIASIQPIAIESPVWPTPEPTAAVLEELPRAGSEARTVRRPSNESDQRLPIGVLAGGAAGVAALAAAGTLVVRRRRSAPPPLQAESDMSIRDGFAATDPVEGLARRLAQTMDPAAAVAGLLSRAYADVLAEELTEEQQQEAMTGLEVLTTRHGRSSTTVSISAPVSARPHLIRQMQAATMRAFGEHTDVDGLVSRDGDVVVRVTWHPRHPVSAQLLDRLGESAAVAWPDPCLVPLMGLYDRQTLSVNWHSVTNVLIAAPLGDGADIVLSALQVALASARAPDNLGFVMVAAPRSLPDELAQLPHMLMDPVDPEESDGVLAALDAVHAEMNRRVGGASQEVPEIVLVIAELAALDATALGRLATIAGNGHRRNVRVLAATSRPVPELLEKCAFLDDFGTRIVRATADEDESVALLGAAGAEELASGGHVLVRLEGRAPIQGWANRVSGDHLSRLLRLMGTRVPARSVVANVSVPSDEPDEPATAVIDVVPATETRDEMVEEEPADTQVRAAPPDDAWSTPIIQQLRAAPLRVQCFGGRDIWYRDRLLWPNGEAEADRSWELLILLAVHRLSGVQSETLVDMLWGEETPKDPARALRQRRWRGREELRRLVPDLDGEPMPTDASRNTSQVYQLNPAVVCSDVHLFLELTHRAKSLAGADAVQAYEEALALYRGDLLDGSDVPTYSWLYDDDGVALTLRSDYRRLHHDARLHLADILAAGPVDGLARAADLYIQLCAEDPEDERLWTALFRVHERAGDVLGLDSSVRRLRAALCELSSGNADPDRVVIPPNLERVLTEIRSHLAGVGVASAKP
jgi:nucleoid-associated protein YgaU/DNA-binding SARP family transcriptional activator